MQRVLPCQAIGRDLPYLHRLDTTTESRTAVPNPSSRLNINIGCNRGEGRTMSQKERDFETCARMEDASEIWVMPNPSRPNLLHLIRTLAVQPPEMLLSFM